MLYWDDDDDDDDDVDLRRKQRVKFLASTDGQQLTDVSIHSRLT